MFSLDEYILINQWVQGLVETSVLLEWYQASPERDPFLRRHMAELCRQARATNEEAVQAVQLSGIKPGRTACVLLAKGAKPEIFHKMVQLRREDGLDVFLLLLHLLRVSDTRRRGSEDPSWCHHWWHRDLGNPAVLTEIRKQYLRGQL